MTTTNRSEPGAGRRRSGGARSSLRRPRGTVSVATFRTDPLYPRIAQVVETILARGKVVAPVDVLLALGVLTPEGLEDWRHGRVPYLERVINCNLSRLSRLLRILRFHAHDLRLAPSTTVYVRSGKRPRERLRFTKTGDAKLEEAYARHFVWPGKGPFHPPAPRREREESGGQASAAVRGRDARP